MRNKPIPVEDLCEGADAESEVEHMIVCPTCGQIFDCRDQLQLRHHGEDQHAPYVEPRTIN